MSIQLQNVGYNAFSLGGLIKGIGDVAGGILTGNPIGGIVSGIHDAFGPGGNPQPPTPGPTGGIYDLPVVGGVAKGFYDLTHPGANGKCGVCPSGYHLNKHPLGATKRHGALPARSMCVRNRHMNPLNGRAAKRSIRRLKGARKAFRGIESFVGTKHRSAARKCGCKR